MREDNRRGDFANNGREFSQRAEVVKDFEIVAQESARALMALTLDGFAIGNGILTVENAQQALVRADPAQGDKGGDAARAALALLELKDRYGS